MMGAKKDRKASKIEQSSSEKPDLLFVPKSLKSAADKGVEAFKIILSDVRKGASEDMAFIRKNRNKGGVNNFRLGYLFFRSGNIRNAKFRFWLASQFAPRSGICYFYMAKVALLEGKIQTALIYLKMALYFKPRLKKRVQNFIKMASVSYPDMIDSLSVFTTGTESLPKNMARRLDDVGKRKKTLFQRSFEYVSKFLIFVDNAGSFIKSVFMTGKRRKSGVGGVSAKNAALPLSGSEEKLIDELIPRKEVNK